MEVEGQKPSSLPPNYVTIHQLKERWLKQQQEQQEQQSPSKPEPENPKPNENAIKPTNTQNQRPNFGRVAKEHKPKEVKVGDNGSASKTLVDEIKNLNKNGATKHNQRPSYRPVSNQPKPNVDDNGSTSKTFVADDFKNLKIKAMADDDGSSTKALVVVDVTDNLLNGENETGNFNLKKKNSRHRRRNPNVVTNQNPTRGEPEPGAKVVEEKMQIKSYPTDKNPELEMLVGKGREGRRHGRRNGNLRFGAEPERKMGPEPEQEAEVVEEKKEKKTDKTPEVEMVEGKWKEGRRYGRRNGNLRFQAEPERKMELEQEAEVVEEKKEKKSYVRRKPADKNLNGAELKPEMEEEVVVEKGKWGRRKGRRNGKSRVVWEQQEKTEPVDGNDGDGGGGGGGGDGVVEEVVKERNVGQGRDRNGCYGNGNSRFGAEPEQKMEPQHEAEVVEEKKSNGRRKPADKNPNGAELKPEMEEEVVVEKGKCGREYGRRNGNSRVVWEQKEKTEPVDGNGGCGDGVVEEFVKEMNVGQGRDKNGDYRRDRKGGHGRDRKGGHGRDRNEGYGSFQKRVLSGSFGEQKGQIWVKKGESVVPN